ncbi:glycosyltransferase [Frondihabitans cladoniiphilus]|uniref:Glycosyl transferase family 28 C-terminal domain-containing protein n=1 Tax=Frondihabitans cladoniiphilus TaxID=715785 RepID=A0ABP8W513_9MICO
MTVVGWYVHHHGAGHVTRFLAVRPHLAADVVVFSSLAAPVPLPARTTWVELPRDDEPVARDDGTLDAAAERLPTAQGVLHWAPLAHPGHTARLGLLAAHVSAAVAAGAPYAAFVVDVSVEITLFVRLLGVPIVVVSQPGNRSDAPHRLAYDVAARILAPWPDGLHVGPALERVRDRVRWVGGISRHDGRASTYLSSSTGTPGAVLVLGGVAGESGGCPGRLPAPVAEAAAATGPWSWQVVGASAESWVADPWEDLRSAEIVVSAAGQNSVADLAAVGARAVIVPQERPFGEQFATARALDDQGLAVVVDEWPTPAEWPAVIERACGLEPEWTRWQVSGAAERAAAVIAEVAAWAH